MFIKKFKNIFVEVQLNYKCGSGSQFLLTLIRSYLDQKIYWKLWNYLYSKVILQEDGLHTRPALKRKMTAQKILVIAIKKIL